MSFRQIAVIFASLAATAQALGSQVIDCQIEKSDYFVTVGSSLRMSPSASLQMTARGEFRNKEQVTYQKDEAIVVADVQILRTTPVIAPTSDVVIKQDGLLGVKLKMPGRRPVPALQEIALPDGRVFSIVPVTQDHAVVTTSAGEVCDVAISYRVPDPYWVHGMKLEPADAAIQAKVQEDVVDKAGLRIIFNGVAAGQLNFQEVWVEGSSIRSSVTRSFDQFAKVVRVGMFDFEVIEVANSKITLRYDIPERGPVRATDVTKAGLRPGGVAGEMVVRTRRR